MLFLNSKKTKTPPTVVLSPQRYVASGQPHILNKTRPVVALHKDRHMFPLSLHVTRLTGAGRDTLFMGVLRQDAVTGTGAQIVKVCKCCLQGLALAALWLGPLFRACACAGLRLGRSCMVQDVPVCCVDDPAVPVCSYLPQFWTTASGAILCADGGLTDA